MALKDCIILVYLDADQFLDLLHWPWSLNCWCSSQTFHSTKIEINFFSSWLYFKKLLRVTYKAVLTFMCLFADTHIPGRYIQEVNKFLGTVCRMLLTVCEDLLQSIFWCPLHGLIGCSTLNDLTDLNLSFLRGMKMIFQKDSFWNVFVTGLFLNLLIVHSNASFDGI